MYAPASEQLHEVLPIIGLLVDGLLEHDHATDVFLNPWCREEKLTICASVGLIVFDLDRIESLSNGSGALVGSENTFAGSGDLSCSLNELVLERKFCFDHV